MDRLQELEASYKISYMRQADWYNPSERLDDKVTLVGVGGIGSPTALALSKLGVPNIKLIDPDIIESHNIPNQLYPLDSVNENKAEAMAQVCESFGASSIEYSVDKITDQGWDNGTGKLQGVVISALDSMKARKDLWDQAVRMNIAVPFFADARLGGENIVIHTAVPTDMDDIRRYEETLYTDEEAREDPCTRQSVADVGFAVAALLTRLVRRHFTGLPTENIIFMNQDTLALMKE